MLGSTRIPATEACLLLLYLDQQGVPVVLQRYTLAVERKSLASMTTSLRRDPSLAKRPATVAGNHWNQ
jgi:hypothetical protein